MTSMQPPMSAAPAGSVHNVDNDHADGIPDTLRALAVPVSALKPYPGNARRGDLSMLRDSLRAHGQYRPLVVNRRTGEVLAGNHTLAAAVDLGWPELAVTYVDVDAERAARIVLVDNRANDVAAYDDTALAALLQSLPDLDGTGFAADDLVGLLAGLKSPTSGDTDPGPVPAKPRTRLGDLYVLGEHRLLCGDATCAEDARRALDGAPPDLLLTDPPYGVSYASIGRVLAGQTVKAIENDAMSRAETRTLFMEALAVSDLRPGGVFYATVPAGPLQGAFMEAVRTALGDEALRQALVWEKSSLVMGRGDYHYRHEPILYGWKPGAAHYFGGGRKQDSIWQCDRPARSDEHPTMKPVPLFERMVTNSSKPGWLVYDPFGGSGTTMIACENLQRRAALIELDPGYCDVIVKRWEQHTGRKATRERPKR